MRYCVNCGSSYDEDDRYCAHCGFILRSRPQVAQPSEVRETRVSRPVEFIPPPHRVSRPRPSSNASSVVAGLVFLSVAFLLAILFFSPSLFGSFAGLFGSLGGKLGSLGGEFGRLAGELGSKFGHLGGELGRGFGTFGGHIGSHFTPRSSIFRILFVVFVLGWVLIPGLAFLVRSRQHRDHYQNLRWD
ncbi:MAG: zinc-ribbon domain-containing protein [Promethearchaeota archaeon]